MDGATYRILHFIQDQTDGGHNLQVKDVITEPFHKSDTTVDEKATGECLTELCRNGLILVGGIKINRCDIRKSEYSVSITAEGKSALESYVRYGINEDRKIEAEQLARNADARSQRAEQIANEANKKARNANIIAAIAAIVAVIFGVAQLIFGN